MMLLGSLRIVSPPRTNRPTSHSSLFVVVDVKDYLYDSTKDVKQAVYGALNCARYSAKSKGWQVVNMKTAENGMSFPVSSGPPPMSPFCSKADVFSSR
jgi:hypothetical protein